MKSATNASTTLMTLIRGEVPIVMAGDGVIWERSITSSPQKAQNAEKIFDRTFL
jgi:hypothetical protein